MGDPRHRPLGRARVEMVTQAVDEMDHTAAKHSHVAVVHRQRLPDGAGSPDLPLLHGEALHHLDRPCHRGNGHPLGFLTACLPRFICDALDAMPLDDPVSASAERPAADAHRLQFAIAHAG